MSKNMNRTWTLAAVFAAVALAGCDPYPAKNKASPTVISVAGSDGAYYSNNGGFASDPTAVSVDAPNGSGVWVLDGLATGVGDNTTGLWSAPLIQVIFNKPLDGSSVQKLNNYTTDSLGNVVENTDPTVCTPATAQGFTATGPTPATGYRWVTCYMPTGVFGPSIVIQSLPATSTDQLDGLLVGGANYTFAGTVKDQDGASVSYSVQVKVAPTPPDAPTIVPIDATGFSVVNTIAPATNIATYDVELSTDGGAHWAIAPGGGALPIATTELRVDAAADTDYLVRVVAHAANGTTAVSGESATAPTPSTPFLTALYGGGTGAGVEISLTDSVDIFVSYEIQSGPSSSGPWTTIAGPGGTIDPYVDTLPVLGTATFYQLAFRAYDSGPTTSAVTSSAPSKPVTPTATATAGGVVVGPGANDSKAQRLAVTYDVEFLIAGSDGQPSTVISWASFATVDPKSLGPTTVTGLTSGSRYFVRYTAKGYGADSTSNTASAVVP